MESVEKLPWLIVYMPYIGSFFCITAFTVCFIITKVLDHLPSWFIFPPISFLGYQMPEHIVYAVFFSLGAICYLISFLYIRMYSFKKHGIDTDSFSSKWLFSATILTLIAPLFLIIQAVLPLQSDILDENSKLTIGSIIHQGSAGVLFVLSIMHATIVVFFIKHTPSHIYPKSSVVLKRVGLYGMVVALVGSIIFHPASNITQTNSHLLFNFAGIAQWIFVAAMIFFFSSYSIDFKNRVDVLIVCLEDNGITLVNNLFKN